jgi:NMD protein affecting ribosome stability and mRNA decay
MKVWEKPTAKDIEQNLEIMKKREEGELTMPLQILNGEFKRKYFTCLECGTSISENERFSLCRKCYMKEIRETDSYKESQIRWRAKNLHYQRDRSRIRFVLRSFFNMVTKQNEQGAMSQTKGGK